MSLLNKLFSAKGLVRAGTAEDGSASGGSKTKEKKSAKIKKASPEIKETAKPVVAKAEKVKVQNKSADLKLGGIILSSIATEKALSAQKLNQYVFKVFSSTNKIEIAKTIGKNYNVKVVSVNIINIPKKSRRVGRTTGFKSGYKKAVVTLAKGQSIEVK